MAASGIRRSAIRACAPAPAAALSLLSSLLMLASCALPSKVPDAKPPRAAATEPANADVATPAAAPSVTETQPAAGTSVADLPTPVPAASETAPQADSTQAAPESGASAQAAASGPEPDKNINTDRSVIVTDHSKASPSTPEAAVQPEPDKTAGTAKNHVPEPTPAPPTDPCDRPDLDEVAVIDDAREMLEEQTCSAVLWLDGLFGEGGGDIDSARRTRGVVEVSNVYSEFDGFDMRARLHVEVDLPTVKNRLSAFVGRENDEDFVRGRTEASELRDTFPTLSDQNEWLAGLGYSLPNTKNLQTSFRVGARGLGPPTGFVQGRLRYTLFSDDNDVSYIKSTPFWNTRDGFGITQSFDYSHVLGRHHLLRWYSVGTLSERSVGLNWRNSAILYHNLQYRRGLAYEAFIRGETDEPEPLYEYGGRVLFRHPVMKQRLYLEWAAGYSFPRTDPNKPRDGSANVGLAVELPFGEPRD